MTQQKIYKCAQAVARGDPAIQNQHPTTTAVCGFSLSLYCNYNHSRASEGVTYGMKS